MLMLSSLSLYNNEDKDFIGKMFDHYHKEWYHSFTFIQKTENFRNDSLIKTSTWYEAGIFPDKFRIDFGEPKLGNAVIFRNDSVYVFRNKEVVVSREEKNDLLFIIGGMYFLDKSEVYQKFEAFGYDLRKSFSTKFHGHDVVVIGANSDGEKVNQLWYDKKQMVLLRMIKYVDGHVQEGIFEDHQKQGKAWNESKITFYQDGKLDQIEYYSDFKANPKISDSLFDPSMFGSIHWKN